MRRIGPIKLQLAGGSIGGFGEEDYAIGHRRRDRTHAQRRQNRSRKGAAPECATAPGGNLPSAGGHRGGREREVAGPLVFQRHEIGSIADQRVGGIELDDGFPAWGDLVEIEAAEDQGGPARRLE